MGAAGVVSTRDGEPFSVMGFTVKGGEIVEIDVLADPVRPASSTSCSSTANCLQSATPLTRAQRPQHHRRSRYSAWSASHLHIAEVVERADRTRERNVLDGAGSIGRLPLDGVI